MLVALSVLAFASAAEFSADAYLGHVKYLASDKLEGRGTGTKGMLKARDYIVEQFKAAGLKPLNGSYLQAFQVTTKAKLVGANEVRWTLNGKSQKLGRTDFTPLDNSSNGSFQGKVVFAGYGISAPEYSYDDYAGLDVKDKIVVVLRYEPQEFDDKSKFLGRQNTRHSALEAKVTNAKIHGAKAVIIAADRPLGPTDGDKLVALDGLAAPPASGIATLMVKVAQVEKWVKDAGKDLDEITGQIDKDAQPRSFEFPATASLAGAVNLRRIDSEVHNVVGYVPGESDEHMIIGAHYDHIGLGGRYSLAPSRQGAIHHGADDNASGVAALIELAKHYAKGPKPKRGILFMAFGSEELGLLGSAYYVEHPLLPLERCSAMINMDMVGRLRDKKVMLGGVGSGVEFKDLVEEIKKESALQFDYGDQATSAGSDHASFGVKKVPYLFFFTGLHGDYHRPSDTWDKINAQGAAELLGVIAKTTDKISALPQKVAFGSTSLGTQGTSSSSGGGYGPVFGCLPDMAFSGQGVRCSEFRAGTPAALAGLQGGDVLVEFDGKPMANLNDYAYVLRSKRPGERVTVKVMRGGQEQTFVVVLSARK